MGTIRMPVSLKFNTEDEFYQDFILDMKEHKTLSGFIVEILEAYYENDDVRQAVNITIDANNPFTQLKQHLQDIQLEHTKTVLATSMLSNQTNSTLDDVIKEVSGEGNPQQAPSQQQAPSLPQQAEVSANTNAEPLQLQEGSPLEQRISELERMLPSLEDKMTQMMELMQASNTPSQKPAPTEQNPINSLPLETQRQEIPVQQETYQPESVQPEVLQEEQNQPEPQPEVQPRNLTVQDTPSPVAPTIVFEDEEDEEVQVESAPSKPASFGKAFGSLKKG